MEAAKEAYLREQFAMEQIDLQSLRRRASEFIRPGLQDMVFPFSLSRLRPQQTVHIKDVVSGYNPGDEPLKMPVVDPKHLVFAVPRMEVPVVNSSTTEPPPPPAKKKRTRTTGDGLEAPKRRRSAKESSAEVSSTMVFEVTETQPRVVSRDEGSNAKNMYEIIGEVFQEFWMMEFDDPGVTSGRLNSLALFLARN